MFEHRADVTGRGVVYQNVEPTEARIGFDEEPLDVSGVADVGLHDEHLAAKRFDFARGFLGGAALAQVIDDDVAAAGGQMQCRRTADAAAAAGNEGGFSGEVVCHRK